MSLKIHLRQIPVTGGRWEGEEDTAFLGLSEVNAKPAGPLRYCLEGGVSKGGFFATGTLTLDLLLQCVACLRDFEYRVHIEDFSVQIELKGRESVDLTPFVREDILLALPPHPRCNFTTGSQQSCPVVFSTEKESLEKEKDMQSSVWEELKKLNLKKSPDQEDPEKK